MGLRRARVFLKPRSGQGRELLVRVVTPEMGACAAWCLACVEVASGRVHVDYGRYRRPGAVHDALAGGDVRLVSALWLIKMILGMALDPEGELSLIHI